VAGALSAADHLFLAFLSNMVQFVKVNPDRYRIGAFVQFIGKARPHVAAAA
jgi:hypothetical protein